MKYRREIDGLRAFAVIPVILFHAGVDIFRGGFIGVDIFFVISGFLITSIIISDLNTNSFSIIKFYERRSRRILPALFFVMAVCVPFAWIWLLPNDMRNFSKSLAAVSVFGSNILFWREVGYFESASELKPLLHTWSLAIEEQFYIFFPLFLLATWRFGRRLVVALLGCLTISSLILAQWGAQTNPDAAFFLLPTRGWELAIGAIAAIFYTKIHEVFISHKLNEILSFTGLFLIFFSFYFFIESRLFPSFYTLFPVLGTTLILLFATSKTHVGKLLGSQIFVGIGLISYSAYLWHQPLFAFARQRMITEPDLSHMLLLSVLSILLAYLSWRFVEQPFRQRNIISRKHVFSFAAVGTFVFVVIGLVGFFSDGYFFRDSYKKKFLDLEHVMRANQGLNPTCDNGDVEQSACRTDDNPEVILWGDSNAMHLAPALLATNPKIKLVQMTFPVCGPILDIAPNTKKYVKEWSERCIKFNDKVFEYIKHHETIKYAVLGSVFRQYVNADWNILLRNGQVIDAQSNSLAYFKNTLRRLEDLGIKTIVVSPTPQNGKNIGRCLMKTVAFDSDSTLCNFSLETAKKTDSNMYKFLTEVDKTVQVIWLGQTICTDGICNASIDGIPIYRDAGHLTHDGSKYIGEKLGFEYLFVANH